MQTERQTNRNTDRQIAKNAKIIKLSLQIKRYFVPQIYVFINNTNQKPCDQGVAFRVLAKS